MFQIGDLILYGSTGVCRVTDITTRDVEGVDKEQLYYILNPLYQTCTISVPVDADKVFMRPIISKEKAERLIDTIPFIQVQIHGNLSMSELEQHYRTFFKTHDCMDLIELTMSIYAKKQEAEEQKRKLGMVDERFMKQAEELLFGELAAALDIPKESVTEYIAERTEGKGRETID